MEPRRDRKQDLTFWLVGIVVLVTCGGLRAQQNPDGVLPLQSIDKPYLFLVRDPVVLNDLKLSPKQREKVQRLNDDVDMAIWSMRNKGTEKYAELMEAATEKTKNRLASILTGKQIGRIAQCELRLLGMRSFLRPDVAERLELTADQTSEIRQVLETTFRSMGDLQARLADGGDADELNQKYREVQIKQQKEVLNVLTNKQKTSYVKMLGATLDTTKLGRIKFKAPEFSPDSVWINSAPLKMAELKGKVVALHFYAFH